MAALSLSILQPTGITVTYWKVVNMHIDNKNMTISANIGGWLDFTSYCSGKTPVTYINENIGPAQFATILGSSNIITAFYTVLSTMPDFSGSTIVT